MCPCQHGRLGSFLTVCCIYWACMVGLPAMLAALNAGDILAIVWAGAAFFGAGWLLIGVYEALSHDDPFVPQSVLWSAGVIALAGYALRHGWFFTGNALLFHLSRAAWFGWIASEAFNLWLNLRGIIGRRTERPIPEPIPEPATTRWRRRRSVEWVEEVEGCGIDDLVRHFGADTQAAMPPVIGQDRSVPQIVDMPDENGQLIPVPIAGRVPVSRRLPL